MKNSMVVNDQKFSIVMILLAKFDFTITKFSMVIYKDEVEVSFGVSKNLRKIMAAKTRRQKLDSKAGVSSVLCRTMFVWSCCVATVVVSQQL